MRKNLALCAHVVLMTAMASGLAHAQVKDPPVHEWRAFWITSPDAPDRGEAFVRFRKVVSLEAVPARFVVHVSADNQFQLHVNGVLVGAGPSIGDLQHWKYETYDLAPFLNKGVNVLSATVWHLGENAPVRQMSDRLGFVLDGEQGAAPDLHTDASWQVELDPGFQTISVSRAAIKNYYASAPGERLDATRLDWQADATDMKSGSWKAAVVLDRAEVRGREDSISPWQLVPDSLPPMQRNERSSGKVVRFSGITTVGDFPAAAVTIPAYTQATLLLDAGQVITAYPRLTVSNGRGSIIDTTYAEALYSDDSNTKGNRSVIEGKTIRGLSDQFLPDGGSSRVFEPLDWRAWRYMQIKVNAGAEPVVLNSLTTFFTAYPFALRASFHSDDPVLNLIWQTGWDTLRICAHDAYMDTPYWERLQYIGDTRVESLVTYVATGDDRLPRQAIEAFHNSLLSDGITMSRYPSRVFQSIPGFSLYYIGMVHDFSLYQEDRAFLRSQMSAVRSTLQFFREHQNANGLVGRLPWWPFVDWSNGFRKGDPPQTSDGNSSILSLQLVEALRNGADLEELVGDPALAREDRVEADRVAAAVFALCWSEKEHLLADTPDKEHFSQHANAYGVWLDVIPAKLQKEVMRKILSASDAPFQPDTAPQKLSIASFYYRFYVARALVHAGLGENYADMLGPWQTMLDNGLTTWAEKPDPTRSDSHAWSAHPTYDLLTIVAGVTPGSPGFTSVRIAPHPGRLRHVESVVATPKGDVRVEFQVKPNGVRFFVDLPAGVPGEFVWNGTSRHIAPGHFEALLPAPGR